MPGEEEKLRKTWLKFKMEGIDQNTTFSCNTDEK